MAMGKRLLEEAVGEMGEEPMPPSERSEAYSPDAEHKAAFFDMCEAIRNGDNEAAWEAYQACKELG